jgi:hypothetical protein
MVYKLTKVYTNDTGHEYAQVRLPLTYQKCKHMTLFISMFNNIFLLHTKTQNHHLKYPICHNKASLKKLFMLMNDIIFTISGHDTLSPLGI